MTGQEKRMVWGVVGLAILAIILVFVICQPKESEGGEIVWLPRQTVTWQPYERIDYWSARQSLFGRRIILRPQTAIIPYRGDWGQQVPQWPGMAPSRRW